MENEFIYGIGTADTKRVLEQIRNKDPKALLDLLVSMAGEKGYDTKRGAELATGIMDGVEQYEATRELLETDVKAALTPLFNKLEKQPPEQRMLILDQALFGLTCAEDEALLERVEKRGFRKGGANLYQELRGMPPVWSPEKEVELKAALVKKVGNLNLSEGAVNRMAKKLSHGDYAATAAAFGREGYFLKCATAMHLYLEAGEGATVEEAVAEACTGVDAQALGDAVHRGQVVEKAAKILLGLAIGAAFILMLHSSALAGEAFFRAYGAEQGFIIPELVPVEDFIGHWLEVGEAYDQFAGKFGLAAMLLSGAIGFLPKFAGKMAAAFPNLIRTGTKAAEQGLEKISVHAGVQKQVAEGEPAFESDIERFTELEDIDIEAEPLF